MSFETNYPKTAQWVRTGGTLSIQTVGDMSKIMQVEIAIGDAGGVPEDCRFRANTVDEAMITAEAYISEWIDRNRELLDLVLIGAVRDTKDEYIGVAGYPAIKNPFYEGK